MGKNYFIFTPYFCTWALMIESTSYSKRYRWIGSDRISKNLAKCLQTCIYIDKYS